MSLSLRLDGDGVTFWVHLQPRASRSELVGTHGDALKVRVTGPPEGGKANEELTRVLAAALGVSSSSVEIVSGHRSRRKRVRVSAVTTDRVAALAGP